MPCARSIYSAPKWRRTWRSCDVNSLRRVVGRALIVGPQGIGVRHGDDIVAGIDEMDLAGDAAREIREQIKSGAAEIVKAPPASERGVPLLEREHHARIADPGAGQRADRPR